MSPAASSPPSFTTGGRAPAMPQALSTRQIRRDGGMFAGRGRAGAFAIRIFCLGLGGAAVAWGWLVLADFWRDSTLAHMAVRIENREMFKPEVIEALIPAAAAAERAEPCRAEALHAAAVVRLRLAETAILAAQRPAIDGRLADFEMSARRALACAPADSFLWAALAWVDRTRNGFKPQQLAFLRLSYETGPHEGWVAARRNRLALAVYERLPADLADAAMREFAGMLASGFESDAFDNLTGPGWPIRERLLAAAGNVPRYWRELLAKDLYRRGYDVDVPGIPRPDARPWG
jgi:hypothetical protein